MGTQKQKCNQVETLLPKKESPIISHTDETEKINIYENTTEESK